MSFDIKLTSGDIEYGSDGDLLQVAGRDKLEQDLAKIMLTRLGSDPGSSAYGTEIRNVIGRRLTQDTLQGLVGKSVRQAVDLLQSLQFVQSTTQEVTFDEFIGAVEALAVRQASLNRVTVELSIITVAGLRVIFSRDIGRGG